MKALYDHTIELIELTKLIERDVCDTMTVTTAYTAIMPSV